MLKFCILFFLLGLFCKLIIRLLRKTKTAFGVSVLIMKDGKVLGVARRADPNDFALPGGKVDPGETEKEAAVRECFEETGLVIWNLKEVLRRNVGPDTGVTFVCDWAGTPTTQSGEPECKWVEPKELTKGVFKEYNTTLLTKMNVLTKENSNGN